MSEMKYEQQVDKSHYEFSRYVSKERWLSTWYQIDAIRRLGPKNVLEIGPGPGLFKAVAATFGMDVETLDLDPALKPDHVGSATAIPFPDDTYDVVCAFQMLEHLPYEASLKAFEEMARVSRRHIVISLPDARRVWQYEVHIPKKGALKLLVPRPQLSAPIHAFDGEHYWEINKRGYQLKRVIADLSRRVNLTKTYRIYENPYHRFFVFQH